jgi:hypothetical protein
MLNVERLEKGDVAEVGAILEFEDKAQEPLKLQFKRPAEQK